MLTGTAIALSWVSVNGCDSPVLAVTEPDIGTGFPTSFDVSSLNITVSNASLEISNDVGNPIPVSGTVTANTGLSQPLTDTQLRAIAVPVSMTAVPPGLAYLST
ncbi:MAG: hypothetical protein ACKPEQ_06130, partial [Dolichospermum sp.]